MNGTKLAFHPITKLQNGRPRDAAAQVAATCRRHRTSNGTECVIKPTHRIRQVAVVSCTESALDSNASGNIFAKF